MTLKERLVKKEVERTMMIEDIEAFKQYSEVVKAKELEMKLMDLEKEMFGLYSKLKPIDQIVHRYIHVKINGVFSGVLPEEIRRSTIDDLLFNEEDSNCFEPEEMLNGEIGFLGLTTYDFLDFILDTSRGAEKIISEITMGLKNHPATLKNSTVLQDKYTVGEVRKNEEIREFKKYRNKKTQKCWDCGRKLSPSDYVYTISLQEKEYSYLRAEDVNTNVTGWEDVIESYEEIYKENIYNTGITGITISDEFCPYCLQSLS